MLKKTYGISSLDELNLHDKRVFLRVDFNCPLKDGSVTDDKRITAALPTVQEILDAGGKLIIGSHLGRPGGEKVEDFSLAPVAERFGELTGLEVLLMDDVVSDVPKAISKQLKKNQVIMLENLRFSPDEKQKSGKLSQHIASYTDVYINDAFGVCHRSDSSVYDLPKLIPQRGAGRLIEKEVKSLSLVRDNPERPFGVVLGGSKVSDKIPMIKNFIDQTDLFVIGGAMAFTFLKAKGYKVGKSLVEEDLVKYCKDLMERLEGRDKKLLLPVDFIEAASIDSEKGSLTTQIGEGMAGFDIGPKSVELFSKELKSCKTILWNGPMGVFENPAFESGTKKLCDELSKMGSMRVVGGGDSAAAAEKFGGKFDHISTGGGASLSFLNGDLLPGLEALKLARKEILAQSRETLDPDPSFDLEYVKEQEEQSKNKTHTTSKTAGAERGGRRES
jgi:phosphoglycerate kinase